MLQPIVVTLTFGAKVDPTKATITVLVEDKFGAQTPAVLQYSSYRRGGRGHREGH